MNDDKTPTLVLDPARALIGLIGGLICLGVLTLGYTRPMTLLVGLVLILVAQAGLVTAPITLKGVTKGAVLVWLPLMTVMGLGIGIAAIRAIIVLLAGA